LERWWRSESGVARSIAATEAMDAARNGTGETAAIETATRGTKLGEFSAFEKNAVLGLLCWGFWGPNATYGGVYTLFVNYLMILTWEVYGIQNHMLLQVFLETVKLLK